MAALALLPEGVPVTGSPESFALGTSIGPDGCIEVQEKLNLGAIPQ